MARGARLRATDADSDRRRAGLRDPRLRASAWLLYRLACPVRAAQSPGCVPWSRPVFRGRWAVDRDAGRRGAEELPADRRDRLSRVRPWSPQPADLRSDPGRAAVLPNSGLPAHREPALALRAHAPLARAV